MHTRLVTSDDGVHHVLQQSLTSWDRHIAADLIIEIEPYLGKLETLPELRRQLAIDGYRGLAQRIEDATRGTSGNDAIVAMAHAMRGYALAHPGLAAASFRSLDVKSPEWHAAGEALASTVMAVFETSELHGKSASHAALILRCLVRGFIVNEMSTPNSGLDFHESFAFAVRMLIIGLPELQRATPPDTKIAC